MIALALAALAGAGLASLLITLLIAVVVLGFVCWLATRFLPHPWGAVVAGVCVLIVLVWLLGAA